MRIFRVSMIVKTLKMYWIEIYIDCGSEFNYAAKDSSYQPKLLKRSSTSYYLKNMINDFNFDALTNFAYLKITWKLHNYRFLL